MHILSSLAVSDGTAFAGAAGMGMVFLIVGLLLSVFWIWMLIDCIMSTLPSTEKLIWFLVIFFLHIVGAALYYFIGRPGGKTRVA